ncbi:DUF3560 domain-containing protein [Paraburkholderia dinghuensis]|uniref:DUF3560 domain-containing protein n=1 Tax=Paraburkholderia dinghuensis TaxID=2305225 RepID=A0A3N6MFJ6_9BURK|nr:DUF3560 domain-containing protein [Paraburkholderia dinghuensis]RQH02729.1 DUF3560 domain-containing protein [Paraburkholderia dinghuensis]
MNTMSATYSPDDNKLRLYPLHRLDSETYARVKAAGFAWAPKQGLFVASMWTPQREDLLLELCGGIGDEDTTLAERAEARAGRFDGYSERRGKEAVAAHDAVQRITEHIPLGQPILVGHHSEKRARKDAERIENGMRRAVKLWETSEYWERRAKGALRHAQYRERADVRHRRIKKIESERRRMQRAVDEAQKFLGAWRAQGLTMERALQLANRVHIYRRFPLADWPRNPPASQYEGDMGIGSALEGGVISAEQARDICVRSHERTTAWAQRWIAHYDNRLLYERAMLGEQGGIASDRFSIEVGGEVLVRRGEWVRVVRVNRKDGVIVSVTCARRFVPVVGIEEIQDYRAPSAEEAAKAQAAMKLPPMCNYPGEGIGQLTKAQWDALYRDYKGSVRIASNDEHGAHRLRSTLGCYAFPDEQDWNKRHRYVAVFLTDAKRIDPPAVPVALKAA